MKPAAVMAALKVSNVLKSMPVLDNARVNIGSPFARRESVLRDPSSE